VGHLYYAQPLLDMIAGDLRIGQGPAGLLVTATQVGYALGIMFIVPLATSANRRRMVPLMMGLSALSCRVRRGPRVRGAALLPGRGRLTTVAGQILDPFAGDLADDSSRGKVVGIVSAGADRHPGGRIISGSSRRGRLAGRLPLRGGTDAGLSVTLYRPSRPPPPRRRSPTGRCCVRCSCWCAGSRRCGSRCVTA